MDGMCPWPRAHGPSSQLRAAHGLVTFMRGGNKGAYWGKLAGLAPWASLDSTRTPAGSDQDRSRRRRRSGRGYQRSAQSSCEEPRRRR